MRGGGKDARQEREECTHVVEDVKSANGETLYGRRCVRCRHQWAKASCKTCKVDLGFVDAKGTGPYYCRACGIIARG